MPAQLNYPAAQLHLSDGTVFNGCSFGYTGPVDGEVVFNTGMVGYPESLTDPSYCGQILVYTYPLIGNYGAPAISQLESDRIHLRGIIVAQYEAHYSHWQATRSLRDWLLAERIPALTGIDTRALTLKLRQRGVMLGRIIQGGSVKKAARAKMIDPNISNLVAQVSCTQPRMYGRGRKQVIVVDCGVKLSTIRALQLRGVQVRRVPWDYNFLSDLKQAAGVLLSNGPGDPAMCTATIAHVKAAQRLNKPIFGICLGSQIQGLAAGATTYKLKFGHRAQNQPCVIAGTQRCLLTAQNHGFAVAERSLPKQWKVWFRNANDQSVEGIYHTTKPWRSVQFHPEANPGPTDANYLFDEFVRSL
jgi:carbamoyl-phosphate synthase small subunit